MSEKPAPKLFRRIRTGSVWRLPERIALGLVVTTGAAVFILIGTVFQLVTTSIFANYLLAGATVLLLLVAWLERITAVRSDDKTILYLIRQTAPAELVYLGGWLLIGGAFGLAGLFAWGLAVHANALFANLFQWTLPDNWLALAAWLFLVIIHAKRTFRLPGEQTTAIGLGILLLLIIVGRVLLRSSLSLSGIFVGYDTMQRHAVAYLVLALWSVLFILEKRTAAADDATPKRQFLILAAPLLAGALLGAAASLALIPFTNTVRYDLTPLVSLGLQTGTLIGLAYTLLVMWIAWYGFRHAVSAGNQLIITLTKTEFFSPHQTLAAKKIKVPYFPHTLIVGFIALVIALTPILTLAGLAATSIMGATLLIFVPEIFRSKPSLPQERPFKLPLHPLFPAAVSLACVIILTFLPLQDWAVTAVWLAIGLIYYFGEARQRTLTHHQQSVLLGSERLADKRKQHVYTVLAYVDDPANAASLIRAGAAVARSRQGRLLVLAVLELAAGEEPAAKRAEAEQMRQTLADEAARLPIDDVPLEILARLSHKTAVGVRDTFWEENANLIVLPLPRSPEDTQRKEDVVYLIHIASQETVAVHQLFPETARQILTPLLGGGHETAALKLAQEIAQQNDGTVTVLYQSPGKLTEKRRAEAEAFVQSVLAELDNTDHVETKIIHNARIEQGILDEAADKDLIVMGLPTEGIFHQTQLGGRPLYVTQKSSTPILLVKREETLFQYATNRVISLLNSWLPALTAKDRSAVFLDMRLKAAGSPDFYILLTLATAIAYFGLVQDSTAVIIGAMLIAPLMNPMMSMAFGIATANFKLIGNGANTTLRGIIAAIGIAALLAVFLPPQPVTNQILSRTQPTYLDLLVALFSGAAGAYAMTRANAAGAIPGVAIAAALVPPLGVAGYGLGLGRLDIAGGALLLFVTNLAAIVLAAALVFLVMGFQPRQDMAYKEVWRNLRKALLAILIISIPLLIISLNSTRQYNTELTVNSVIQQNIPPEQGLVTDVVVENQRLGGLYVRFVLYAYQTYSQEDVDRLQGQLGRATGETVTLQVTTINATLSVIDKGGGVPTPTPPLVDTPAPDLTAAAETVGGTPTPYK